MVDVDLNKSTQTLSAWVLHALLKISPNVFVETYRMLHDWSPDRSLFDGERLLGVYPLVDQPRLGPIHVLTRTANGSTEPAAREWFAGNTRPLTSRYDADHEAPIAKVFEVTPEAREQNLLAIRDARLSRRASRSAPASIADDDVLWDLSIVRDWYAIRALVEDRGEYFETLVVASFDWEPGAFDRTSDIVRVVSGGTRRLLELEYQRTAIDLNNSQLFQVRRRARLTAEQYIERFRTD
jgi:hypothetical protein